MSLGVRSQQWGDCRTQRGSTDQLPACRREVRTQQQAWRQTGRVGQSWGAARPAVLRVPQHCLGAPPDLPRAPRPPVVQGLTSVVALS